MAKPYFSIVPVRPATTNPNIWKLYWRDKTPWFDKEETLLKTYYPKQQPIHVTKGHEPQQIPSLIGHIFGIEGKLFVVESPADPPEEFPSPDPLEKPSNFSYEWFVIVERHLFICNTCGRLHMPGQKDHEVP